MCKAQSKVTHIKHQKCFHHENIFAILPVTLLWALHLVIKLQFFLHLLHNILVKTCFNATGWHKELGLFLAACIFKCPNQFA